MRTKNLKIQMLVGNSLKICVGADFEKSSTLILRVVKITGSDIRRIFFVEILKEILGNLA